MTRLVCLAALTLAACADSAPSEPMTLGVSNVTDRRLSSVEFSVGETPLGAIGPVDRDLSTIWQDAEPADGVEGAYGVRVLYGLGVEETLEVPRPDGALADFLHVRVTRDSIIAETPTATVGMPRIAPDAPRAAPAVLDSAAVMP